MKKILLLFITIMFLCVSCSGAIPSIEGTASEDSKPGSNDSDNAVNNQDKPVVEDTGDIEDSEDTEDPVVSPNVPGVPGAEGSPEKPRSAVDEALQLYLAYIDELKNDDSFNDLHWTISLVFIDGDDIPELVIDRSYPHGGIIICTVSNGVIATILAEGAGGGINYIDGENKFSYMAIIQDIYYDVVCSIEDGTFVILHEGFHDASENQWYWGGEAVSYSEYFALQSAAFDVNKSEYTGMNSIRFADMIYEINMQLSDSSPIATANTHDPVSGLLTSDGAFAVYDSWRDSHPDAPLISRQSIIFGHDGEQYYYFPAKYTYMYYFNILVHMETGELLHMLIEDGMDPNNSFEPLDDWYN